MPLSAPQPKIDLSKQGERMALKVGEAAPDFTLKAVIRERQVIFKLSELRGKKNAILAFYPLDWTPV